MPSAIPVPAPMAAPPKFGLRASLTPEKSDERWFTTDAVITYSPEGCQEGVTDDPCTPIDLVATDRPSIVEWHPYVLRVTERCSTFSGVDENKARAVRLLEMDTERQLGAELWDGAVADAAGWPNTWLANDDATFDYLSEDSAVGLVHGLACLEQYLASKNGGQQGVIHATPQVVTHWESFRLLRREGNRILTFKDTVVIPSPGYSGTAPNGTVGDDNVWAYATDMPRLWLGPVKVFEVEESVDRENNAIEMTAFRPALVEWERCRHGGIKLAVDVCDIGGS